MAALKPLLEECGYTGTRLKEGYTFGLMTVPLVGFATKPWDFDSACIAIMEGNGDSTATARSCREMGAPIVWVPHNGKIDWWMQQGVGPTLFKSTPVPKFAALVRKHKAKLDPVSVYRGKTIARVDKSRQLDFVDVGLLPLLREEAGEKLHRLVEDMTRKMLEGLGVSSPSQEGLRPVFSDVFRLLAGKVLKDKDVHGFKGLDLTNPADVLSAVAGHYNASHSSIPIAPDRMTGLTSAASLLSGAGNFGVVSPETLAYVYEHTLVSKALRKRLGIHATPPSLVDYMVWRLYDWIREIPEADRHVFEPACGHAPFLSSAMRLLRLEMQDRDEAEVHDYLKAHIHGIERDDFAREIARLSLTLADIPNPDGWDVRDGDIYESNVLAQEAAKCRILLSNPPYERFGQGIKQSYAEKGEAVTANKQATEMLLRTLRHLPPGGVFGVVMPVGVLRDKESRPVRERLLADFELSEISIFADNLFEHGHHEVAVLMGRRKKSRAKPVVLKYRRVREKDMEAFKKRLAFSREDELKQAGLGRDEEASLYVPDLPEVWAYLDRYPRLGAAFEVSKGVEFFKEEQLRSIGLLSTSPQPGWLPVALNASDEYTVWGLPIAGYLKFGPESYRARGGGPEPGVPQVVINHSGPRAAWRFRAVVDAEGIAVGRAFLVFRADGIGRHSLLTLWAVLNSPVANGYAYSWSGKRHTLAKEWRAMPLPDPTPVQKAEIESAAANYRGLVAPRRRAQGRADTKRTSSRRTSDRRHANQSGGPSFFGGDDPRTAIAPNESAIRDALLRLDAEVLKLYNLPPRLERQLLDLFTGVERKGVNCDFRGYYAPGFTSYLPLQMLISDRFQRAAADVTADRFRPGESAYVRDVLNTAAAEPGEE